MFDKLPLIVQHVLCGFMSSAAYVIVDGVLSAKGVTGVKWDSTLMSALNAGTVGAMGLCSVLWLTPFSRKYGVGSNGSTK
jgi:hypothetical protein